MVLVLAVVIVAFRLGMFALRLSNEDSLIHRPQVPEFEVQKHPKNETAVVRHVGGEALTTETSKDSIMPTVAVQVQSCPKYMKNETLLNATVEHDGRTSTNGWWAAVDKPAVASFPITTDDSVRVIGDGRDADGDGTAGIEAGDYIGIIVINPSGEHPNMREPDTPPRCTPFS